MSSTPISRRHVAIILAAVAVIFAISSNMAWLNPRPAMNLPAMLKLSDKIPFMWQYNDDSQLELGTAAFFPRFYARRTARISRPLYPMAVKAIATVVGVALNPVIGRAVPERRDKFDHAELLEVADAVVGYILLKLLVFAVGSILLYRILLRYLDAPTALFAVLLFVFHPHSIRIISTYHTSELQMFTPIAIVYLLHKLADRYSMTRVVVYSLITGLLMLGKQNYATYFTVLLVGFFVWRRRAATVTSFAVHLVPLGLWILFLYAYGLRYHDAGAEQYGSGVWFFDYLAHNSPLAFLYLVFDSMKLSFMMFSQRYTILAAFALVTVMHPAMREQLRGSRGIFLLVLCALVWLQMFAAKFYRPDLTGDLSFAVFGLGAYAITTFLRPLGRERLRNVFLAVYFCVSVLTLARFPWVPPSKQGVAVPVTGAAVSFEPGRARG